MKKHIYMSCIMLIQVIPGILICKTQYSVLYAIPIGVLTGFLFFYLKTNVKTRNDIKKYINKLFEWLGYVPKTCCRDCKQRNKMDKFCKEAMFGICFVGV